MRSNRWTLLLGAILGLRVALPAKLWREVREVVGARSAERSFRRVARTAMVPSKTPSVMSHSDMS